MTHHTEAERAGFEEWRIDEIRKHLPAQDNGDDYIRGVFLRWSKKHQIYQPHSEQIRWEAWQAARRAPAAPVPQGLREAAQAVVERWDTPLWKDVPATAVYIADLRAALAAAPHPPEATVNQQLTVEAAPMQLPEPAGWIDDGGIVFWNDGRKPNDGEIIYTEHQVHQLLAAHGINVKKSEGE